MAKSVSFYGPMSKVLGGGPIERDYMQDPRRIMAQQLMQQGTSTAPVQSPLEGITRALTAGVGGYFGGEAQREMKERESQYGTDMATVLAGARQTPEQLPPDFVGPPDVSPGGYEGMSQALAGIDNPDLAQFGQQLAFSQIDQEQAAQAAELQRKQDRADYLFEQENKSYAPSTGPSSRPASPIQNFRRRQELVEEFGPGSAEVRRFDSYVRALKYQDIGGSIIEMDPEAPASPTTVAETTLAPEQEPEYLGEVAEIKAAGAKVGAELGDAEARLSAAEASLPRLESAVEQLKSLGETATYTLAGQAADVARRQTGMDPTEGAIARSTYIAHVKNNVLPLLRQTFGAAFTAAEGDSLLATLGDADMHPSEKEAVLNAFISDKKADLEALRRQVGTTTTTTGEQTNPANVPQSVWDNMSPEDQALFQ